MRLARKLGETVVPIGAIEMIARTFAGLRGARAKNSGRRT